MLPAAAAAVSSFTYKPKEKELYFLMQSYRVGDSSLDGGSISILFIIIAQNHVLNAIFINYYIQNEIYIRE